MKVIETPPRPSGKARGRIKVCLLGERGVGKTALAERFALGAPPKGYRPTQEARRYRKRLGVTLDSGRYLLDVALWEVPGDLQIFSVMDRPVLDGVDGAFIVCDASRPSTLEAVPDWAERVRHRAPRALLGLLVNKGDLHRRRVGPKRAAARAQPLGLPWILTSAAADRNVDRAFVSMAVWVLQRHLARRARPAPRPLL